MSDGPQTGGYRTLAERVASAYARSVSGLGPPGDVPEGSGDLLEFCGEWYRQMAEQPEAFGLPVGGDMVTEPGEGHESEHRQEVQAKVRKVQEIIGHGLTFLYLAGRQGRLSGESLVMDRAAYVEFLAKQPKIKRRMLDGMALGGLEIKDLADGVTISNRRYPRMMPALAYLAQICSQQPKEQEALFHFSRCDFSAKAPGHCPEAPDLYRMFTSDDRERLLEVHRHLSSLGYRTKFQVNPHGWEVQYQGSRKIKSSPLLHVECSMRFGDHPHLRLKCVSSARIVPLVEQEGPALQADFRHRIYKCRRDEGCDWCQSRKGMGPSVFTYDGEQHLICWYTRPDTALSDDAAVEMVKAYADLHERLAATPAMG